MMRSWSEGVPSNRKREPDPLFDAIAEVTCSDPKVSATHIGKVASALRSAEPPYAPEEIRRFREWHRTWSSSPPTLGYLQKEIGRVRATQAQQAVETEFQRRMREHFEQHPEEEEYWTRGITQNGQPGTQPSSV